jgi:hypothetical protein
MCIHSHVAQTEKFLRQSKRPASRESHGIVHSEKLLHHAVSLLADPPVTRMHCALAILLICQTLSAYQSGRRFCMVVIVIDVVVIFFFAFASIRLVKNNLLEQLLYHFQAYIADRRRRCSARGHPSAHNYAVSLYEVIM